MAPYQSKTYRIIEEVIEDIKSGVFAVGERIPSNRDMCMKYDCSYGVVRSSLVYLKALGLVEGRRGVGVFVTQDAVDKSLHL